MRAINLFKTKKAFENAQVIEKQKDKIFMLKGYKLSLSAKRIIFYTITPKPLAKKLYTSQDYAQFANASLDTPSFLIDQPQFEY